MEDNKCPLCNLEKKTKWYYEDWKFIVCDCLTCGIPMIVHKSHGLEKIQFDIWWHGVIYGMVKAIFKGRKFKFREEPRKIKDHWHWHIILEK